MASEFDLVLRGGLIAEGAGGEPFIGDVAIFNARIAAVRQVEGAGLEEVGARGKVIAPGFVDIHTHYDAQRPPSAARAWRPARAPMNCNQFNAPEPRPVGHRARRA
jgi:N-acyl-D-aspartate/D-glutamate deacylase